MLKAKLYLCLMGILLITACSINNESGAIIDFETDNSVSRANCAGLPATKSVTVTASNTVTITTTSSALGAQLNGIANGSRSYYYSDSCYSGTIRSSSYIMVSAPTYLGGDTMTCTIRIVYSGTVNLSPCANQPASKSIVYPDSKILSFSKTKANMDAFLNAVKNGLYAYNYSDTCYSGTLKSSGYKLIFCGLTGDNIYLFQITVTFSGTVYKK